MTAVATDEFWDWFVVAQEKIGSLIDKGDAKGNRIATAAGSSYTYDGDGNRVKKIGATSTLYWGESFTGGPLEETDLSGTLRSAYVYLGGKRVARRDADGSVHYYFSDQLGTADVVTNATGSTIEGE